jgi:uncharacterized protein YjbI with pentapeptide repeats
MSLHARGILLAMQSGSPSNVQLQNEKLREQIRQLQLANQQAASFWHYVSLVGPTLVGIAAILTFGLGWWRQQTDARRQREQDRASRRAEAVRHFDATIPGVIANLGSGIPSLQASAVSMLEVFAEGLQFNRDVFRLVIANLRLLNPSAGDPDDPDSAGSAQNDAVIKKQLISVLGSAIRHRPKARAPNADAQVDVSETDLPSLDIAGAQLRDVLIASGANLTGAILDNCDVWKADFRGATLGQASLRRANLGQARLDRAEMQHAVLNDARATSASFRGIDGRFALFRGAALQSAHFDGAKLLSARFEGAKIADAYFLKAELDQGAIESLRRAENWQKAHFDPEVQAQLRG